MITEKFLAEIQWYCSDEFIEDYTLEYILKKVEEIEGGLVAAIP